MNPANQSNPALWTRFVGLRLKGSSEVGAELARTCHNLLGGPPNLWIVSRSALRKFESGQDPNPVDSEAQLAERLTNLAWETFGLTDDPQRAQFELSPWALEDSCPQALRGLAQRFPGGGVVMLLTKQESAGLLGSCLGPGGASSSGTARPTAEGALASRSKPPGPLPLASDFGNWVMDLSPAADQPPRLIGVGMDWAPGRTVGEAALFPGGQPPQKSNS